MFTVVVLLAPEESIVQLKHRLANGEHRFHAETPSIDPYRHIHGKIYRALL
jgi:hypothetical protein